MLAAGKCKDITKMSAFHNDDRNRICENWRLITTMVKIDSVSKGVTSGQLSSNKYFPWKSLCLRFVN